MKEFLYSLDVFLDNVFVESFIVLLVIVNFVILISLYNKVNR